MPQALSAKATRAEGANDYDAAFMTYIQAAKSFLHISQTAPAGSLREKSKSAAAKCLERAERIKAVKKDLTPVRKDIFSAGDETSGRNYATYPHFRPLESQKYVLDKSSRINHLRFRLWTQFNEVPLAPGQLFW